MKKRWNMKKDNGYSLVEMIIVIAIIAVMCGVALTTITLINSAKTKEAGVLLNSEVSGLIAKCKSQVVVYNSEVRKDLNHAIAVYKNNDNKYYIVQGYYKYDKSSGNKIFYADSDNANGGKGTSISSKVSISYVPGAKNSGEINDVSIDGNEYTVWAISFDKTGRCICGVGTYELNKKSDNSTIDTFSINANGSHDLK